MRKNAKDQKYLARATLLPGVRRFDPCVPLRKRRSEDFSVSPEGYFEWEASEVTVAGDSEKARPV